MTKVIKESNAVGYDQVDMILSETLSALNEMTRIGGFAPSQWVLGRLPRVPGSQGDIEEYADVGTIQAHLDGPTAFGIQNRYRLLVREQFVKWDLGERMQRAICWNASSVDGPYEVGDVVSFY